MGVECGTDCMVHKQNIIVNPTKLKLGSNVRIVAYCTLSCGEVGINIGSHVHIAGYVSLFGGAGITVGDYASIASGAKVYSVSDDVSGRGMVGPCVPLDKRHLHKGHIQLGPYSVLCVNSVVMPRGSLGQGAVLLPFTVLNEEVPHGFIKGTNTAAPRREYYK
jgi:galactoside O-acetyltransferase